MTSQNVILANLPYLLSGAIATLKLVAVTAPIALAIGIAVGIGRLYAPQIVRIALTTYVELFRGTPALVQMFFAFFGLPMALGWEVSAFTAATWALSLNSGAYFSEIVRGGVQSISRGQWEAGYSLNLRFGKILRLIVLPQVVRRTTAPAVGQLTILIKDTSIASVIGVFELTRAGQHIIERTLASLEIFSAVALIYFVVCFSATSLSRRLETRFDRSNRGASNPWRYVIGGR